VQTPYFYLKVSNGALPRSLIKICEQGGCGVIETVQLHQNPHPHCNGEIRDSAEHWACGNARNILSPYYRVHEEVFDGGKLGHIGLVHCIVVCIRLQKILFLDGQRPNCLRGRFHLLGTLAAVERFHLRSDTEVFFPILYLTLSSRTCLLLAESHLS
jgi:hypothetical protein